MADRAEFHCAVLLFPYVISLSWAVVTVLLLIRTVTTVEIESFRNSGKNSDRTSEIQKT
jgi:hypothetical protein